MKVLFFALVFALCSAQYTPDWESIDSRPLPDWYDQAKFGIFVHWSTFSVPAFAEGLTYAQSSQADWDGWNLDGVHDPYTTAFHNRVYGPNFTYAEFGPMFRAELFNADTWAEMFAKSGAKYVVLTSKHHDGFCNWPSAQSWNWNSVDTGPHQDNVALLTQAVRNQGLTMGLYFSQFEWFNPLYLKDKATNGTVYPTEISLPQMQDLVNTYKPDLIWSDGDWEMPYTYWNSTGFLAWLYNDSPVKDSVVVNDRWGDGMQCHHGGYYTCQDRYNPGTLQNHKWENALTIDKTTWGYNRFTNLSSYMTIEELLFQLASTVACGGNMLLNVGPTADGRILPIFEERLMQLGSWLSINGESIYNTTPWRAQNETVQQVWYTSNGSTLYAIALAWPTNGELVLFEPIVSSSTTITILGYSTALQFTYSTGNLAIQIPDALNPSVLTSQWAWVFKMTNVS